MANQRHRKKLDAAIFATYGWRSDLPSRIGLTPVFAARTVAEDEIRKKILSHNLERGK